MNATLHKNILFIRIVAMFMVTLFLFGCFELEQKIVLTPDGAAIMTFVYRIPKQNMPLADVYMKRLFPEARGAFDENILKTAFNRPDEGVEIRGFRKIPREDHMEIQVVLLVRHPEKSCGGGLFGTMTWTDDDTSRTMEIALPGVKDDWNNEDVSRLETICKGMKLSLEVHTPKAIVKTTGVRRSDRCVVWHFSADQSGISVFSKLPPLTVTYGK